MKKVTVLYHADCPDGKFAAYAAWLFLVQKDDRDYAGQYPSEEVQFLPIQHGDPVPLDLAPIVYILDFSFKRGTLEEIRFKTEELYVIDHHKTAEESLKGFPGCTFDMEHSGAILAWQHFYPLDRAPRILRYVEDRDLWVWKMESSKVINNTLMNYIFAPFEEIHELVQDAEVAWESMFRDLIIQGTAIEKCIELQIARCLLHVRFEPIHSQVGPIPIVNSPLFQSELVHALCDKYPGYPCAACYWDRADGCRQYSLRSIGDFDVSAIAKFLGGGGHKNAAGFTVKVGHYTEGFDKT